MGFAAASGVALLLLLTGGIGTAAPLAAHALPPGLPHAPLPPVSGGVAVPAPPLAASSLPHAVRFGLLNRTLPVHPAAGGTPTSSYPETPALRVPNTTPTVISFPQAVTTCCVTQLFTAPAGPFSAIEFTYTGSIVGNVYDSSYRAYVDGVQFLEGTSPEYGTWTVHKDLTEYTALFHGTVNLTLLIGVATLGGHFVTNLSLAFYPVSVDFPAPRAPSEVVPLWEWNHTYLHTAGGSLWTNATVPANATNATLELFLYGFGPTDEFWYSAQPGYRQVFVTVDGRVFATALPFPYLNTGGIDLFLWRPVTADFTIDDRPLEVDVSGALGLLEGTHQFGANLSGGLGGSNTWLIGGSLLVYTSPGAGPATSTSYRYQPAAPYHQSGATYDDTSATAGLWTSSTLTWNGTRTNLSTVLSSASTNDQALGGSSTGNPQTSTQNVTMDERLVTTTYRNTSGASVVCNRTLEFPFVIDLSNVDLVVSKTGSTETVNFTTAIPGFRQEWRESDVAAPASTPGGGPVARVDDLTTASGSYAGQETVNTAGGGATLTNLFGSVSAISKSYSASLLGGFPPWTYSHLLSAAASDPPGPYNAQTLLANSVSFPLSASGSVRPALLDLGQSINLSVATVGGAGGYQYAWSQLPPGCTASDRPSLTCRPTAAGTYDPVVAISDVDLNSTTVGSGAVTVEPALAVNLVPNRTAWDAGQNLSLAAVVTGGTGILPVCTWQVNGTIEVPSRPCDVPLNLSGAAGATTTVEVSVSDSTGFVASSPLASYSAAEAPLATLVQTAAIGSALRNAGGLEFNVTVLGGSPPFAISWTIDGTAVPGATGSSLVWIPARPGNVSAEAWVTDAAGLTVGSGPVSARAAASGGGSGGAHLISNAPGPDETGWYVAGAAIVAAAILGVLWFMGRRPPPRTVSPSPPPRRVSGASGKPRTRPPT